MKRYLTLWIRRVIWAPIILIGLAAGLTSTSPAVASTTSLLDSADYTFVYPDPSDRNGAPNPTVWNMSAQGNVAQQPVEGLGMVMSDPDNVSALMYAHSTPFLSGDPNDPNFQNTATFRVRANVPYVLDGSSAWSTNAIGWRMILDDGAHRLELALSRSPAFVRQVRIQNSGFDPIDFHWDSDFTNTYEIKRLANGDFELALIHGDPANPYPVISTTVPAAQLPPSGGEPMFSWGMGQVGGGAAYWVEASAHVHGSAPANRPPTIHSITAPLDPVPVNTTLSTNAEFTDPDSDDTHTAIWDWGDGSAAPGLVSELNGTGTVSGNHIYDAPGVYPVLLTVTDDRGASTSSLFQYIVAYDSGSGFVTGGGWIDSSAGSYLPDPALSGKANFGFVSKYKKGAEVPTGQAEFQFHLADLKFHSDRYDWLVLAGHKAIFKGAGTINGSGNYGFIISAIDEMLTPSTATDLFRIKIWDKDNDDTIVYDNQVGADEGADPTTAISGGNVMIHKG